MNSAKNAYEEIQSWCIWVCVFVQKPRMNRHLGKAGQIISEIDIPYFF
jgi:hypothetical protein